MLHRFKVGDKVKFLYKSETEYREITIIGVEPGKYIVAYRVPHVFYSLVIGGEVINHVGDEETWTKSRIDRKGELVHSFQWRQW